VSNARLQALHSIGPLVAPYATGDVVRGAVRPGAFQRRMPERANDRTGQTEPTLGRGARGIGITAGFAAFSCTLNGQPMGAYACAETLVVEPTFGSAGHWYVVVLGSVIAVAAILANQGYPHTPACN
jgi:hypothetical protein